MILWFRLDCSDEALHNDGDNSWSLESLRKGTKRRIDEVPRVHSSRKPVTLSFNCSLWIWSQGRRFVWTSGIKLYLVYRHTSRILHPSTLPHYFSVGVGRTHNEVLFGAFPVSLCSPRTTSYNPTWHWSKIIGSILTTRKTGACLSKFQMFRVRVLKLWRFVKDTVVHLCQQPLCRSIVALKLNFP